MMKMILLGFPDVREDIIRTVDLGEEWVIVEIVFVGTHAGPYLDVPNTSGVTNPRAVVLERYNTEGLMTNL